MNVLVVGSGGREHAICVCLAKSSKLTKLYCAPGNGGISDVAECVPISVMDFEALADFAVEKQIDITIVGMDAPLVDGIVDYFENRGLKVFGPRKNAAILEGSKVFSKALMKKYGIPSASYESFSDFESAAEYVKTQKLPIVVKADGLALGKGVLICETHEDAVMALKEIMVGKKFGDSGNSVVIEEFLVGRELSLLSFCDGKTIVPMVSAQDYKRAYDNDEGLNTGGMGAISPSPIFTEEMSKEVIEKICIKTKDALIAEGREFKGVIYFGLISTANGVKVIEYNARFGDPETQVVLPRLKTDLLEIFTAVENGTLSDIDIEWDNNSACCVVIASGGYPESYEKGFKISGLQETGKATTVYHAGTIKKDGEYLTSGGRVLGVTAIAEYAQDARYLAYNGVAAIKFDKMQFRTDIGR